MTYQLAQQRHLVDKGEGVKQEKLGSDNAPVMDDKDWDIEG